MRREIQDESVDLIYLDPPFNSAQERALDWLDERREFNDCFGDVQDYAAWMRPRLLECVRVLKSGGALFLHCDWRASHHLKVLLDELLGSGNFVNEIVWRRHNGHSDSKQGTRHFGRNADTILFYGKGERKTWHPQFMSYDDDYLRRAYRYTDESGRRYALSD